MTLDNFGIDIDSDMLATGGIECDYWWNGDEDVFYGALEFYNQCPIKINYIWPPSRYTEEYFDVCDTNPEMIEYVQKSFENQPTVHIHSYNDQSDPNYIITDFNLRVDKSKYKIHAGAHGGLSCYVNRRNEAEEYLDSVDPDFHLLGLQFYNIFPSFPTANEIVTSGLFNYNIEYFDADELPDIKPFDGCEFNPYQDYFPSALESSVSDEGSHYLITYSHRQHY